MSNTIPYQLPPQMSIVNNTLSRIFAYPSLYNVLTVDSYLIGTCTYAIRNENISSKIEEKSITHSWINNLSMLNWKVSELYHGDESKQCDFLIDKASRRCHHKNLAEKSTSFGSWHNYNNKIALGLDLLAEDGID